MMAKMLFLLVTFINYENLNPMLLKEALTVRVPITCKKSWNIMGKTVIYQLRDPIRTKKIKRNDICQNPPIL